MAKKETKKVVDENVTATPEEEVVKEEKEEKEEKKETAKKYTVTGCILLNVRQAPSTEAKVMGCLKEGAVISGVPCGDAKWVQVQSESLFGYCMRKFLKPVTA